MVTRMRGAKKLAAANKLERISAEIAELEGKIGRDIYEIGRRLADVRRGCLYEQGGYRGFRAWLDAETSIPHATAWRFMRVAEHFNAAIARRYGVSKLLAAIRFLEATSAHEQAGDLMASEIRIRDDRGRFENISLHEATTQQIAHATVLLFEAKRGADRIPQRLQRRMERLTEALPQAPPGTRSGKRVRAFRGDDGKLAFSFQAIPEQGLEEFVAALREYLVALR
jgi:hypothetical protein